MNIENIITLNNSLRKLGFNDSILEQLATNVSFKVPSFVIRQRMIKDKDVINFYLAFELNENSYCCVYYDAILRKEIKINDTKISEIEVKELDRRMAEVNWTDALQYHENKNLQIKDKTIWSKEEKVENIVTDLQTLEAVKEGQEIATRLKVKYWCDSEAEKIIGNLNSLRGKFEVSQRFYFFEGQGGISVEEAYRFLQNRWTEKQLLARKREMDNLKVNGQVDEKSNDSSGKGLLQTKRKNKKSV